MGNFLMRPEDELMHQPDASVNFNESVYTNGFNTRLAGRRLDAARQPRQRRLCRAVGLPLSAGRPHCLPVPAPRRSTSNDALRRGRARLRGDRAVEESVDGLRRRADASSTIPNALRDPQTLFATDRALPGHVRWTHEAESPVHGGEPVNDSGADHVWPRFFARPFQPACPRAWRNPRSASETFADRRPRLARSFLGAALLAGDLLLPAVPRQFCRMATASCCSRSPTEAGVSRRVGVLLVDGQYEEVARSRPGDGMDRPDRTRARVEIGVRTAKPQGASSPARSSRWRRCATAAKPTARRWSRASPKASRASPGTASRATA